MGMWKLPPVVGVACWRLQEEERMSGEEKRDRDRKDHEACIDLGPRSTLVIADDLSAFPFQNREKKWTVAGNAGPFTTWYRSGCVDFSPALSQRRKYII